LNDSKDTSLIELSGRVQFQPDVEIEEYADDAALEVIDAASPEFDHDRVFSIVYQHPDGRVEYVISGPVFHANSTAQTVTEESNPPNAPPSKKTTEEDGILVLGDENDKPIPNDTPLNRVSETVATAAPTSGKRKRAASNAEEASIEPSTPKNKKARKDQGVDRKTTPTGRKIATPKNAKADVAATPASAPATAAKGKRRRGVEDDDEAGVYDSPLSKKARTERGNGSETAATGRPITSPKKSRRDAAVLASAAQAPSVKAEGRSVADDQEETSVQGNAQAAGGRPIATPKKSKRNGAAPPVDDTKLPAAAPVEKSKKPTKKASGTTRNGRQVVVAGPDPDQVPAPVKAKMRGREDENEQNKRYEERTKRVKQS
jgi:hypothetical protein